MGMCAEIIAIGPYSPLLDGFLEYRPDFYKATNAGTIISERLFGIAEGSTLSSEFAALFGISDPWDFNQHRIDNSRIDLPGLQSFSRIYDHYSRDVEALEVLIGAGFEFHFRPEG